MHDAGDAMHDDLRTPVACGAAELTTVGGAAVLVGRGLPPPVVRRTGERFHEIIEERCDGLAAHRPGHVAIDTGEAVIEFSELDARANQLARYLLRSGVRAGDRVGLLFDRAPWAYVSMLAVSKAHAAFVPLDPAFPADRLGFIAADAELRVVLTLGHLREAVAHLDTDVWCLDGVQDQVAAEHRARLTEDERGVPVDDLSYVVYTSGSTGRPKGVAVEHASICNFVRVAAEVYGLTANDRVYQGMTIAFDFSVEEIWVPLAAGATLVPKPAGSTLLGRDLWDFLNDRRVTALCCVPTLLATLDADLPDLRFLLVSGEACPQDLVTRWHRADRRFLNVYGPTEATVTATWAVVHPDRPVTLGVPLPTYAVVILDPEQDRALATDEMGEIGIAGVGLARGYVRRGDLTARAFVHDFLGLPDNPGGRIYRTGDLGRINVDGEVEYHGRIDTQVKIRGYRIELAEIESVLLEVPGIAQAVVGTHAAEPGNVELVAYYTLRADVPSVDRGAIRAWLRDRLPGYMVPAYFEQLDVIPMLPSDKADRKRLPPPRAPRSAAADDTYVAPATELERLLAEELAVVVGQERVSVDSHLFDDLGVNSLMIAHFCARVREHESVPPVSMKDVYTSPTVRDLAVALPAASPTTAATVTAEPTPEPVVASSVQYLLCGTLQLIFFLASSYVTALIAVYGYRWLTADDPGLTELYGRTLLVGAVGFLAFGLWPIVLKWLLVGEWKATAFPVWSLRYLRFWVVKTAIRSSPFALFLGSPLYNWYLRALGAHIGRGVVIFARDLPVCTDLLWIGDDTVIRKDTAIHTYRAQDGLIQTGPIVLGRDVLIGEKSVLDIDTSMGAGAQLGHASALLRGQAVPAGARWHGSPAQPTDVDYATVAPRRCSTLRRAGYATLQLSRALFLYVPVALLLVGAFLPATSLFDPTTATSYSQVVGITLLWFEGAVLGGLLVVLTVPRLLHRFLEPGRVYPLYGLHFALQRAIARLTNAKFYADLFGDSSFIVGYLKAIGYRLDPVIQTGSNFGTELQHESPLLSTIGSGTMVSDALSIMNADFSSTSFRVSSVTIGARNYLGNNLAFPTGARVGDNCLLATKALVPIDGELRTDVGLLGSPAFEIPRSVPRDRSFDLDDDEIARRLDGKNGHNLVTIALFLLVRYLLFLGLVLIAVVTAHHYAGHEEVAVMVGLLAGMLFGVGFSVLVERAAAGFRRLRPRFCSLYDHYFWTHERLWKLLATAPFSGTPFKNVVWRLLGVRIGRRVFDDGCAIPEKTLVAIGDDCMLNAGSVVQCHSLEDGVFKSDHTTIGANCTLGVESFVHYGVTVGDGSVIEADSFLMKGEAVPPGSRWGGNPARALGAARRVCAASSTPSEPERPRSGRSMRRSKPGSKPVPEPM